MNVKTRQCEDINECAFRGMNQCMGHSVCINTPGSYYCQCPTGMEGEFCSIDINECDTPKARVLGTVTFTVRSACDFASWLDYYVCLTKSSLQLGGALLPGPGTKVFRTALRRALFYQAFFQGDRDHMSRTCYSVLANPLPDKSYNGLSL